MPAAEPEARHHAWVRGCIHVHHWMTLDPFPNPDDTTIAIGTLCGECGDRNAPHQHGMAWRVLQVQHRQDTARPISFRGIRNISHYYKAFSMYSHRGEPSSMKNDARNGLYCTGLSEYICSVPSGFLPCRPISSCTIASAHTMLSSSSDLTL